MLSLGPHHGHGSSPSTSRVRGEAGSRSNSVGRRSGEIIEEEDEEDVEEVEEFSPVRDGACEEVVEEEEDTFEGAQAHP